MEDEDVLRDITGQFDPFIPLPPGDSRYVDCDAERGSDGLRRLLINTIKNSAAPRYQLIGGHRGGGKTTELLRVKRKLEDDRYFVVYCEADAYLSIGDSVESGEVMLAIAQQLWLDAKRVNVSLETNRLISLTQELWKILNSPVQLTEIGLEAGFAKIKMAVQGNHDYRQQVRQYLRPKADELPDVVNELIQSGRTALSKKGYQDIVVIVDNLDRLLPITPPGSDRTSHETLFIDSADILRRIGCHWIFTLPIALRHSLYNAQLDDRYGCPPRVLPMIPITTREGEYSEAGIAKLIEIIVARMKYVGTTFEQAFDTPQTARQLAIASGGYVRALMTLVTEAISYSDALPVTSRAAEQAIRRTRDNAMIALKNIDLWPKLRTIAQNREVDDSKLTMQLLESFVVLEYLDRDGPWFDVSPVIKDTVKFKQPSA